LFVDAHNAGVQPDKQNRILKMWLGWIHRKSDITIVTNTGLEDVVKQNRGSAMILPDPLPQIDNTFLNKKKLGDQFSICFICTFHSDEPYESVFNAMKEVPSSVSLYVTGKISSKIDTTRLSSNIRLMGFLPEPEFWSLLYSVDVIMDLTTRENCLVCGAYEGTALKKPLILSDTRATRDYFCTGAIYVQPDTRSIIDGINRAIEKNSTLKNEILELNVKLQNQYLEMVDALKGKANNLVVTNYGCEVFYE
jgi:glycosyltransferase involved in cell wall biosynthesis